MCTSRPQLSAGFGTLLEPHRSLRLLLPAVRKSAVEGLGDCVYDALVQTGWFDTSSDELKVLLPEPFMTFSDYLEGMYEADAKIERESVSELLASGDDLFKKIDEIRNNYSGVEFDVEKFREFCKELNVNPMLIGHVIEAIFSQKAGVTQHISFFCIF